SLPYVDSLPSSHTPTRPPSTYTLFPYTTLFRSDSRDALRSWLETVPAGKILAYGDDLHSVDLVTGHTMTARDNICRVLAEKVKRSEEHTSELQSRFDLVCRLLLEKKKRTRRVLQ